MRKFSNFIAALAAAAVCFLITYLTLDAEFKNIVFNFCFSSCSWSDGYNYSYVQQWNKLYQWIQYQRFEHSEKLRKNYDNNYKVVTENS